VRARARDVRTRDVAHIPKRGNQVVTGNRSAPPTGVTILKHCRCIDCLNFSKVAGEYFCTEHIGGTKVSWATSNHECDPPPHTWHYCSHYTGPQISRDVWVWPKVAPLAGHVGAGSTIAPEVGQPDEDEVLI
jgi:hypothetical protein